jgi:NADH:ubiquinone oxidoreductase subunit D
MDKQKLARTMKAFDEMQASLKALKQSLEAKKYALGQQRASYKQNVTEKNARLENLNKTVAEVLAQTAAVIQKIDMVLNEDGSDNNNN